MHQTAPTCTKLDKLHQAAPNDTNLHHVAPSSTKLNQVAPNCTNLHQLALSCNKIHQVALKKKRNYCGRDFPISFFFKHGCWRPSRRWYWYPVICFSWTYFLTFLLTNSACPAFLWDGRGNFHADVRFIVLLTYPSDNYCVGAAHKRSKMD